LIIIGDVYVESVEEAENPNSSLCFATVLAECLSGYSGEFKVRVWSSADNDQYRPVENAAFHVEGKLTFKDGTPEIEAYRFYPVSVNEKFRPPMITGTAIYQGKPKEGCFELRCNLYACGVVSEVTIISEHSSKQYNRVESTIVKGQEIFLFGSLQDVLDSKFLLSSSHYSYLVKSNTALERTLTANLIASDGTNRLVPSPKRERTDDNNNETPQPSKRSSASNPVSATNESEDHGLQTPTRKGTDKPATNVLLTAENTVVKPKR